MKLYKEAQPRNTESAKSQLKLASGGIHNHTPHGFESVASFEFGDVYVSDSLYQLLDFPICDELDLCLSKMLREDYGCVDADTVDANCENRYFGNGKKILGRYSISVGVIEIYIDDTFTSVTLLP